MHFLFCHMYFLFLFKKTHRLVIWFNTDSKRRWIENLKVKFSELRTSHCIKTNSFRCGLCHSTLIYCCVHRRKPWSSSFPYPCPPNILRVLVASRWTKCELVQRCWSHWQSILQLDRVSIYFHSQIYGWPHPINGLCFRIMHKFLRKHSHVKSLI